MSKEFALEVLDAIKCFYRRLYHFPEKKAFISNVDFECHINIIDGIKNMIENNVKE